MFVASMAFFAKVSDPRSGGTYMTLLNTLANLGGTWPATVVLWLVDVFTWKTCITQCKDGISEVSDLVVVLSKSPSQRIL